jgi:hypothetical protein
MCAVLAALAPAYGADPLSAGQKGLYEGVTNNIIRAAEKMPESNYSFKPSPDVRSFGQLVGHLAELCVVEPGEVGAKDDVVGGQAHGAEHLPRDEVVVAR